MPDGRKQLFHDFFLGTYGAMPKCPTDELISRTKTLLIHYLANDPPMSMEDAARIAESYAAGRISRRELRKRVCPLSLQSYLYSVPLYAKDEEFGPAMARFLIDLGGDVNELMSSNPEVGTPLHKAIQVKPGESLAVFRALVEHGKGDFRIRTIGFRDMTALHKALHKGFSQGPRYVYANVTRRFPVGQDTDQYGCTPLHSTAAEQHLERHEQYLENARYLIEEQGADVFAKATDGSLPIDRARTLEMSDLLHRYMAMDRKRLLAHAWRKGATVP